mgnify:CR=1 FL=1
MDSFLVDLKNNLIDMISESGKNDTGMSINFDDAIQKDKQYYADLFNRVMSNN